MVVLSTLPQGWTIGKLGQSSYAAAKEGIRGLSRVAAAEWVLITLM